MTNLPRDDSWTPISGGVSSADGRTVLPFEVDPTTLGLLTKSVPGDQIMIYDQTTNATGRVDTLGNLRVAQQKRILGTVFNSTIDTTYVYAIANVGTGTTTATTGEAYLNTGTTALSSTKLTSINKARYLSGRANIFRALIVLDAGVTNNVREWGVQTDTNNKFVFRLSGTTFSCVVQRAGVETIVSSGSFNGNGTTVAGTFAPGVTYHQYEVLYTTSSIRFMIDNVAVHRFVVTTTSLISSVAGTLYMSNANSGALTTDIGARILTWSISQLGNAVNNPTLFNITAVGSFQLKTGGGTLQSMMLTRAGGVSAQITIYDSVGTATNQIGQWDAATGTSVGAYQFGPDGWNFYNGLYAVVSGTFVPGSATILWD